MLLRFTLTIYTPWFQTNSSCLVARFTIHIHSLLKLGKSPEACASVTAHVYRCNEWTRWRTGQQGLRWRLHGETPLKLVIMKAAFVGVWIALWQAHRWVWKVSIYMHPNQEVGLKRNGSEKFWPWWTGSRDSPWGKGHDEYSKKGHSSVITTTTVGMTGCELPLPTPKI